MLAFIGGTGIYSVDDIAVVEEPVVETPFGSTVRGRWNEREVLSLAREAQICFASIGIVTDYACWMDNPVMHIKATEIFTLYRQSIGKAIKLLQHLMLTPLPAEEVEIRQALAVSILTPDSALLEQQRQWLEVLRR